MDTIHDCFVNVMGKVPTDKQVETIFNMLPDRIKYLADEWGWNDTEVGDAVCVWIRTNKSTL